MLSYKSLFALLFVIGMATALPIGGGGSELPLRDLSEIMAYIHKILAAIAELQKSVPGAPTVPSLPSLPVTLPPVPTLPSV
ncbi:unnamed protein product [Caenorhabditis brenneri]